MLDRVSENLLRNFCFYAQVKPMDIKHYWVIDLHTLQVEVEDGRVFRYDEYTDHITQMPDDPDNLTDQEFARELGRNIERIMHNKNMTQKDLCEKSGISEASLSCYINGRRAPSFRAVDKLARTLSCSIDEFRYLTPRE